MKFLAVIDTPPYIFLQVTFPQNNINVVIFVSLYRKKDYLVYYIEVNVY